MDPRFSPAAEAFRSELRTFLAGHLPPDWKGIGAMPREEALAFTEKWRDLLYENGLLGISWPKAYGGGGRTKADQVVMVEEFARAGVPAMGPNDTFSVKMV